jgi:predicted O-methyltransferase YrrM
LRPKTLLRNVLRRVPALNQLLFLKGAIKGHFYSPVPSLRELSARSSSIFGSIPRQIHAGIDLRETEQLRLALELVDRFYIEQPFSDEFLSTGQFTWCDAITLYSMIRHSAPNRVIEIGSGRSSLVTLDTNKRFFRGAIECTLIEPFPSVEVRRAAHEYGNVTLVEERVQDVTLATFTQLESADILFIDSSHVSKVGSDVNHIFFEILPRLRPGIRIHFHDVFYPFEYPEDWIREGRAWNEAYLLRAFLQFNPSYTIELWMNYLIRFHREFFQGRAPLLLNDPGGSIWVRKIG